MQHFKEVSDVLVYIACVVSSSLLWERSVIEKTHWCSTVSVALPSTDCCVLDRSSSVLWGERNTGGCVAAGLEVLMLTWKLL